MPTLVTEKSKEKRAVKRSLYPRLWTAEEFLDWLRPGVHADLIAGQLFMHSPVNIYHGRQLNTLDYLLRGFIDTKQLGELFRETIAVRFDQRYVFLPDLCYFNSEQVARLVPGYVPFAPNMVVEALSPRTARRDTGVKFAAYKQYGVQEYWILNPIEGEHRFYAREGDLLVEFAKRDERIQSRTLPGFYIKREWLSPVKAPSPTACLREILSES